MQTVPRVFGRLSTRAAAANFGVGSWIERRARSAPARPALISGRREITYAELAERIRRLANGLRSLGVGHGDRVAWIGENDPAFLEAVFAAGLIGAAVAPVNDRLPSDERAYVLRDTEPVVLIERAPIEPTDVPSSVRERVSVATHRSDASGAAIDYEALVRQSSDSTPDEPVDAGDLLLLPHTSGTTGKPKGVMLTHGNVTWNAVNAVTGADFRAGDVTIAVAPFFRVGGTGVNVLPVLFLGGTVVVPEDTRPDELLTLVERHSVTVGFGNPDLLDRLVRSERWPDADLSSIRFIITGGAPVPERLLRTYLDRGVTLLQGYGLSEAAPIVLLLDAPSALTKVGSAGLPPPFVDVTIVGDDGRNAEPGEAGELWVRGPNVMAGYWRRPEATREVLTPDGWLRTGDAARADDEGYVWIVDRANARFVTAGGSVFPGDVERVLMAHPAVRDAGVVGKLVDGQTVPVAFVVLGEDALAAETELLDFARADLPARAVPVSIRFTQELPRTSVGKLRRDVLDRLANEDA